MTTEKDTIEAYRRGVADAASLSADLVELSPADRQTLVNHLRAISRAVSDGADGHIADLYRATAPSVDWSMSDHLDQGGPDL